MEIEYYNYNGDEMLILNNDDITKPQKLNSLEIKRNNIYAYIKKGLD